jgi:hypothetical protein
MLFVSEEFCCVFQLVDTVNVKPFPDILGYNIASMNLGFINKNISKSMRLT